MSTPVLFLASTSPRRRQLLTEAGIGFALCEPGAELDHLPAPPGTPPAQLAHERAQRKALGARSPDPRVPVLGVDTVVDLNGVELGKAPDRTAAAAMLRRLAGRVHRVHTAHCLWLPVSGACVDEVSTAVVVASVPTEAELAAYLDSGDWRGKAGAYGIQDPTQAFLRLGNGALDTVVGMHVAAVRRLLAQLGGRA
ncbi:MAG: Maf family protein [Planctomycetes bacterium]|nr:Maf family protein [Planctomycetota bacterium]